MNGIGGNIIGATNYVTTSYFTNESLYLKIFNQLLKILFLHNTWSF